MEDGGHSNAVHSASSHHAVAVAVPRKAAGDVRAYERVETEPGLDKFVDDAEGHFACHVADPVPYTLHA